MAIVTASVLSFARTSAVKSSFEIRLLKTSQRLLALAVFQSIAPQRRQFVIASNPGVIG
jgi:hypothetical protein